MKKKKILPSGVFFYSILYLLTYLFHRFIGPYFIIITLFFVINPLTVLAVDYGINRKRIFQFHYLVALGLTLLFDIFLKYNLMPIQNSSTPTWYMILIIITFFIQLFIVNHLSKRAIQNSCAIPILLVLPLLIFGIIFGPSLVLTYGLLNMTP